METGPREPFDPLQYDNIAKSIVHALFEMAPEGLGAVAPFEGAGIYALYYHGPFAAYARIAGDSPATPIYVGKAIPPGGRKGADGLNPQAGKALSRRLREHAASIG